MHNIYRRLTKKHCWNQIKTIEWNSFKKKFRCDNFYLFGETFVGTDNGSNFLDFEQGCLQIPLVLLHQERDDDRGRPADPHLAVDQDFAGIVFGLFDEGVRRVEVFELRRNI